MPYTVQHLLINFHGAMPGGEIWSVGFRTQAAAPDLTALQPYADYAADAWRVIASGGGSFDAMNPIQVTFVGCTVRLIGVDGKTVAQAEGLPTAPSSGSNSAPGLPNQCAITVSLLTARAGRSYRGRVYLPALTVGALSTTGRLSADVQGFAVDFVHAMIGALNGTFTPTGVVPPVPATRYRIAIESKTSGQPPAPVTLVRCGDVIDTQRRRRDKLSETYLNRLQETPAP